MIKNIKGIILDFDGLMVDTETIWYEIYRDWFQEEHSYELSVTEFSMCVGSTDEIMFKVIGNRLGYDIKVSDFESFGKPIFVERTKNMDLLPGVKLLIEKASSSGVRIALATSSFLERPKRILEHHNILHLFDVLVTREDVENTKPDPEVFNTTARMLDISKDNLLIFEDSLNGLIAGNKAGIDVVIVPNEITNGVNFENYFAKITSLTEFKL